MCNENAFTLHQSSRKILQEYSKKGQEPNEQRVVSIATCTGGSTIHILFEPAMTC